MLQSGPMLHLDPANPLRRLQLIALGILICAVGALVSCGGDSKDESFSETKTYLTQLSSVTSLAAVQLEGIESRYPTRFQEVEPTKDYYADYLGSYARFLDATKQLSVPDEVADAHNEYIAASEALLQANQARLDELESATTIDEVNAIFADDPDYTAIALRQDKACQGLKDIGDVQGVPVPGLGDCNNLN